MTRNEERRRMLSKLEIFSQLGDRELEELIEVARVENVPARAEIFHKGDEAQTLFVILSGRLKVTATSAEGEEVILSIMEPHETIGEVALFASSPRTGTVTALEPCELLVLHRRDLMRFLKARPEVTLHVLEILAGRLLRLSERVEDTRFLNLPGRLAKQLLRLAGRFSRPAETGVVIDLRLSQTDLAEMAGATREAVNKQMQAWKQEGIVHHKKGQVTILDPDRLRGEAGER